jgi:hypothetical protein
MRIGAGLPFKDQRGCRSLLPADTRPPATSQAPASSVAGAA